MFWFTVYLLFVNSFSSKLRYHRLALILFPTASVFTNIQILKSLPIIFKGRSNL
jgi:hypothetical protein